MVQLHLPECAVAMVGLALCQLSIQHSYWQALRCLDLPVFAFQRLMLEPYQTVAM